MERIIVKDFKQETKTHKEKLVQNHRVRKRLNLMQEDARKLMKIYDDDDGARKEEIAALAGTSSTVYSKFYDRLKEVRDYHRRFPNMEITEAEDDEELLKEEPYIEFTGEEGFGKFVDIHANFMEFVNSKFGSKISYYEYLSTFTKFEQLPKRAKYTKAYMEYLQHLFQYLQSFFERTQPLAQFEKQMKKLEDEFEGAWEQGHVAGWEDKGGSLDASALPALDLDAFESVEDLEIVGAERLKETLASLGLKCGGTPRERAQRLFQLKGKTLDQIDRKLFAKGAPTPAANPEEESKQQAAAKEVALMETKVVRVCDLLASVIIETLGRVEKKQAQTYEELQAEMEEAEAEVVDEPSDEEDEFIYNPLKLPLGWDGKPIPYWLYKLHGLNQEFKCEICGNYSYWGRRAFEKHFKEWRHQNGMRALGIPNNKNFYEVTKIDDALDLWRSMAERQKAGWKPDTDEEFEDKFGNVYNKKTYDDMRRQGLID